MTETKTGCDEYRQLSRRQVIGGATAATVASALGLSWLPQVSFAQSGGTRDVLISIFLRGGVDGLSVCVPFGAPEYLALRPNTAVPEPDSNATRKGIALNSFYGLHPALAPLMPAYTAGHLLIAHAVGVANWSRSHFDAQRWMEVGRANDATTMTGWLGRHLATSTPSSTKPLRGLSLTHGMARTLAGGPKTLSINDPDRFGFTGNFPNNSELSLWVGRQYNRFNDATTAAVQNTRATVSLLDAINFDNYQGAGGATYENNDFGYAMKSTAAMIVAQAGVEAVHIDLNGFDTHADQGTIGGDLDWLLTRLGNNLGAFYTDMASRSNLRFTVVVLSEFGRTARENGARGTDHGSANCMFVLGGGVIGGRVMCQWPGLAREQLKDFVDLKVTLDYRHLLAEIVQERLGNTNLAAVFPGFTPSFRNIVVPST